MFNDNDILLEALNLCLPMFFNSGSIFDAFKSSHSCHEVDERKTGALGTIWLFEPPGRVC